MLQIINRAYSLLCTPLLKYCDNYTLINCWLILPQCWKHWHIIRISFNIWGKCHSILQRSAKVLFEKHPTFSRCFYKLHAWFISSSLRFSLRLMTKWQNWSRFYSSFLSFQFRVFTAPFHRVEFADFWLADQLNSLVVVLMDLEYLICFYIFELQWGNTKGLLPSASKILGEGQNWMNDLYALCTSACCHKELEIFCWPFSLYSIFHINYCLSTHSFLLFIRNSIKCIWTSV